jgi:DNA-nicking Smr family endonuclease
MYSSKKIKNRDSDTKQTLQNRPFACLKSLLDEKKLNNNSTTLQESLPCQDNETPEEALSLFEKAMSDVIPLIDRRPKVRERCVIPVCKKGRKKDNDSEVIRELEDLIEGRGNFRVIDTAEYIEGLGRGVHKRIAEELHEGKFSYQDHLDLHGYNVEEASYLFNDFLKNAVRKGYRCVLIIHGRGKSSPRSPKLKENLCKWLSKGYWRKWVIAYTSAQLHDGGGGATYILLYSRPQRKIKKSPHDKNY